MLFCSENNLENFSEIRDKSSNHITLVIITRFDKGASTAGTCYNIRCEIRSYYKRIIKVLDE